MRKHNAITLGTNSRSSSIVTCFNNACEDMYIINVGEEFNDEDVGKFLRDIGWIRREFYPSIDPWFCCKHCAFDSIKAKTLVRYWNIYSAGKTPEYDLIEQEILEHHGF